MLHENILKEAPHLNEKIVTGYRTLAREYSTLRGRGVLGLIFAGNVLLASQSPYP